MEKRYGFVLEAGLQEERWRTLIAEFVRKLEKKGS